MGFGVLTGGTGSHPSFLLELTVIREWLLWQRGMGSRIWGRVELLLNLTYIFMEDSLWQTMYPMIKTSVS